MLMCAFSQLQVLAETSHVPEPGLVVCMQEIVTLQASNFTWSLAAVGYNPFHPLVQTCALPVNPTWWKLHAALIQIDLTHLHIDMPVRCCLTVPRAKERQPLRMMLNEHMTKHHHEKELFCLQLHLTMMLAVPGFAKRVLCALGLYDSTCTSSTDMRYWKQTGPTPDQVQPFATASTRVFWMELRRTPSTSHFSSWSFKRNPQTPQTHCDDSLHPDPLETFASKFISAAHAWHGRYALKAGSCRLALSHT